MNLVIEGDCGCELSPSLKEVHLLRWVGGFHLEVTSSILFFFDIRMREWLSAREERSAH